MCKKAARRGNFIGLPRPCHSHSPWACGRGWLSCLWLLLGQGRQPETSLALLHSLLPVLLSSIQPLPLCHVAARPSRAPLNSASNCPHPWRRQRPDLRRARHPLGMRHLKAS